MNEIDQRVTIAELMGYKWLEVTRADGSTFIQLVPPGSVAGCVRVTKGGAKVIDRPVDMDGEWKNAPDYLNDLNEMAKVEATLTGDEPCRYGDWLGAMVRAPENAAFGDPIEKEFPMNGFGLAAVATMSAAERAEAYLRVKEVWYD